MAPPFPRGSTPLLTRLAEALALSSDDDSLEFGESADRRAETPSDDPADAIAQHCVHPYVTAATARCRYLLGNRRSAAKILEQVLSEGCYRWPSCCAATASSNRSTDSSTRTARPSAAVDRMSRWP